MTPTTSPSSPPLVISQTAHDLVRQLDDDLSMAAREHLAQAAINVEVASRDERIVELETLWRDEHLANGLKHERMIELETALRWYYERHREGADHYDDYDESARALGAARRALGGQSS